MPTKLTGLPSFAYLGVEAPQPPNIVQVNRAPTTTDFLTFNTGDLWLNIAGLSAIPQVIPTAGDIWMLVSKQRNIGRWVNFGGGGGNVISLTGDSGGPVLPAAGNINVISNVAANHAGASIKFEGNLVANTLTFSNTDALNNVFFGALSGNLVGVTGNSNLGFGHSTLPVITSGTSNVAIGGNVLMALTTGSGNTIVSSSGAPNMTTGNNNVLVGYNGLYVTTGSNNIAIGAGAGGNYVTTENSNIVIGVNLGTVGDNNKVRIGVNGTGAGQQNQTFLNAGNITKPNSCSFGAFLAAPVINKTGNGAAYQLGTDALTISYDLNNNFNVNGTFTAPVTGIYNITVTIFLQALGAANTGGQMNVVVTGTSANGYILANLNPGVVRDAANNFTIAGSVNFRMTAGDTAVCNVNVTGGAGNTVGIYGANPNSGTVISGFLIG